MSAGIKHRIEMLAFGLVACVGAFYCASHHYCFCGHEPHGAPDGIGQWVEDCIWLFALVATTILGLRGHFHGARPIGIVTGLIILLMVFAKEPLRGIDSTILAILIFVQSVELMTYWRKGRMAERVGASDGGKAPNKIRAPGTPPDGL